MYLAIDVYENCMIMNIILNTDVTHYEQYSSQSDKSIRWLAVSVKTGLSRLTLPVSAPTIAS